MRDTLTVREARKQHGPFWLHNSRGAHEIDRIHRVNARLFQVTCKDGKWFSLPPDHLLSRRP